MLTGIAEIDAAGGNDTVIVSLYSGVAYRLGSGNDVLVLVAAIANFEVTVVDFNKSGVDRIDLRSLSLPSGFVDLQLTQQGAETQIAGSGVNLRLLDTLFTDLDPDDFLFW